MRILEEAISEFSSKKQIHQRMMVIGWLAAGNLGLWALAFKQSKWANVVHFYCMGILTLLTWMSALLAITEFGVAGDYGSAGKFHVGLGIAVMVVLALQCMGGMMCQAYQKNSMIKADTVSLVNLVHRVFGYIIYILALVQLLAITHKSGSSLFIVIIVISLVSYIAFFLQKILRKRMQECPQLQTQPIQDIPLIKHTGELAKYQNNYFIFADKIYDIGNVITNHPGGYEIINYIRGKEVDRFLYGTETLEAVGNTKMYGHTAASIQMAGEPIGVLAAVCPFSQMAEINDVRLEHMAMPCKSKQIYAPYLVSKNKNFIYQGYSDLSQIGKYYALTIQNKKTRLYTLVNFLHISNLELMSRTTGINHMLKFPSQQSQNMISPEIISLETQGSQFSIPLLIKKYENGDFTPTLLVDNFKGEIQISKPRGLGMSLHEMPSGRIVLFAGGTGLQPFCDLIDLLFKQLLIEQSNPNSNEIAEKSPLVRNRPLLQKFKPSLYLSVQNTDQIHAITAHQLNQLTKSKSIDMHLRVNNKSSLETFTKAYPEIPVTDYRFDVFVPDLAQQLDAIAQIYLCGPPGMTNALSRTLMANCIPVSKFRVL